MTMAKYSRFDPRNKNKGKHKNQSINKELKFKEVNTEHFKKQQLKEIAFDNENADNEYAFQELRG